MEEFAKFEEDGGALGDLGVLESSIMICIAIERK